MTVTDMERLEQAARLSMGGIADAELPATLPRHIQYTRIIGLTVAAAAALAMMLGLL